MEQVFAPWRINWVKRDDFPDNDGCVFCSLPERKPASEALVLATAEHGYIVLNNFPYNPGHVMVIPFDHIADFELLDEQTLFSLSRLQQLTIDALRATFDPDGFNIGLNLGRAAGGSIRDHLHVHVVPRWTGDTNFMPVIADTKVLVEGLSDSYERLRSAFADHDGAQVHDESTPVDLTSII